MSNQEKASHLKKCLLTIGVNQLELSVYMERALENERRFYKAKAKMMAIDAKLAKAQAEVFNLLLTS